MGSAFFAQGIPATLEFVVMQERYLFFAHCQVIAEVVVFVWGFGQQLAQCADRGGERVHSSPLSQGRPHLVLVSRLQ